MCLICLNSCNISLTLFILDSCSGQSSDILTCPSGMYEFGKKQLCFRNKTNIYLNILLAVVSLTHIWQHSLLNNILAQQIQMFGVPI